MLGILSGCSTSDNNNKNNNKNNEPEKVAKAEYDDYDVVQCDYSTMKYELDYVKARNTEDCFTYQLSSDGTYYAITGLSKLGKAICDVNEQKLRDNFYYLCRRY